jgi:hypothetical protein
MSGKILVTGLFGQHRQMFAGESDIADGNENHQGPIAIQESDADPHEAASFEEAEERRGQKVGYRNAIEDATESNIGPGMRESAVIKHAAEIEQEASANDAFEGLGAAVALERFGEGKDERYTDNEYEEGKNQVVEMESFPVSVFELICEKFGERCRRHVLKGQDEGACADDPEHVEAAEGIDGNEALWSG